MRVMIKNILSLILFNVFFSLHCYGAPFEIKVHEDLIADYQQVAFEIESNLFNSKAMKDVKNNVFQTRIEYGYGISRGSEVGVNVFLSNYNGNNYFNGGKISHMYIPDHDEEGLWHYGFKNEVNFIHDIDGVQTNFYELTPIVSLHNKNWKYTLNTSIDVTLNKEKKKSFSPSFKVGYRVQGLTFVGIEYYVDNLPFGNLGAFNQQPNTGYVVIDSVYDRSEISFGLGKGFATSQDNWIFKVVGALNF